MRTSSKILADTSLVALRVALVINLTTILHGVEEIQKNLPQRKTVEEAVADISIETVLSALNSFTDIVRYLNTRRSTGAILHLSDEAAVQDVLFLMLRPWMLDLVPETPTDKIANRYSIRDFGITQRSVCYRSKVNVRDAAHGYISQKRSMMISRPIGIIPTATISSFLSTILMDIFLILSSLRTTCENQPIL